MNANDTTGPESPMTMHLDDEQLLALLDAGPGRGHAALRRHAGACTRCSADYARLEADAAVVSAWFAATEPAPGHPSRATAAAAGRATEGLARGHGAWLKAAAALLLLAAPAAAIPGVRGWIGERLTAGAAGGGPQASAPAAGSTIRFIPAVAELVVRVDAGIVRGRLTIAAAPGEEARIELASPGASATVSEVGVTLRAAGGEGSFHLVVPPAVARVRVVGSRPPTTIDTRGDLPAVIDLGG